jgi:hypothetical protein
MNLLVTGAKSSECGKLLASIYNAGNTSTAANITFTL